MSNSNSTHDLLRECAQQLIMTADRIAGIEEQETSVASSGSGNTATSTSTRTATSVSATAANAVRPAGEVWQEHRRIFGFRSSSSTTSRSRSGARVSGTNARRYAPYRAGQTWTRAFVCMASIAQMNPPSASQRIELSLNGLGERKIEFPKSGTGPQVHEAVVATFPQLGEIGYELMRCAEGRSKSLLKILMPSNGFSVDFLKSALGQAKGYIRPLQKDIPLEKKVNQTVETPTNKVRFAFFSLYVFHIFKLFY